MRSPSDFSFAKPGVRAASDTVILPQQRNPSSQSYVTYSEEENPFDLDQLPSTIGPYEIRGTVGEGSFSIVKLVYHPETREYYACKVIERSRLQKSNLEERFETEIRIHQQLHHPSIVELVDIFKDDNYFYVIMEFCPGGELFQYIVDRGRLTEPAAMPFIIRILEALKYLHSIGVVHRDLKPENLLLDKMGRVKLSDFGLSRFLKPNGLVDTPCGSPCYASPECLSGKPYDGKKSDCWSVGVIFFAMVTGQLPWTKRNQTQLFEQIRRGEYTIPTALSPMCRDFIANLMKVDLKKRMTADVALNHPFLLEGHLAKKDAKGGKKCGRIVSIKRVDQFFDRDDSYERVVLDEQMNTNSHHRMQFESTARCLIGQENILQRKRSMSMKRKVAPGAGRPVLLPKRTPTGKIPLKF